MEVKPRIPVEPQVEAMRTWEVGEFSVPMVSLWWQTWFFNMVSWLTGDTSFHPSGDYVYTVFDSVDSSSDEWVVVFLSLVWKCGLSLWKGLLLGGFPRTEIQSTRPEAIYINVSLLTCSFFYMWVSVCTRVGILYRCMWLCLMWSNVMQCTALYCTDTVTWCNLV